MRRAVALEKGEDDLWDLKYAAGGLIDIDFIAQHLQLVYAADKPDILSVSTLEVLDNAAKLGVLEQSEAEVLRSAARLYHDLTQILRLCVSDRFKPETAGEDLLQVMARAGDAPDFSALQARVKETQAEQRVLWYEAENAAIAKMKAAGTEIITDIDKKPFQDAVKPVWDKYGAKYAAMVKRIEAVN